MSAQPYQFTAEFEKAAALRLLVDPVLLSRVANLIKPERFESEEVKLLVDATLSFFKQFGQGPTPVELLQRLKAQVNAGKLRDDVLASCATVLEEASDMPPILSESVLDMIAASERKYAVWGALDEGLRIYKTGNYEEIAGLLNKAVQIGKTNLIPGASLAGTLAERTEMRKSGKSVLRWGTGIDDLDDVIMGGLAAGELGCVLGAPKHGKSQFLGQIAYHVMKHGGTVIYFTLELSEAFLLDRLDACISGTALGQLAAKADAVQIAVDDFVATSGGCIIVKQFPPGETTVGTLEAYMRQERQERSTEPTMVIADYGDLLGAENARDGRFQELGLVYTQLRALAVNWKIPVWTASQAKREALEKKTVTMADIGESFKKVAISDVVVAICGTEQERSDGIVRVNVAACRYASSSVTVGPYQNAFAYGRFTSENATAIEEEA